MGAVLFDADRDEDLDLYVVSGGVEYDADDRRLRDRLYLNDGRGNFTKALEGAIPDLRDSGGPVAAGDFDRDGDLDLFVGGRVVPGAYPSAPLSRLLRNESGRFIEVTKQFAPATRSTGMVTGCIWTDTENDGWLDLMVTHEWGPIKLFKNDQGKLVDQTERAGLAPLLGWWNGIAGRDIDGDQDIDYVVTNFGLNTKYHASAEAPTLLYQGDFDGSGRLQLVEAELEGATLFPIRGRSCSTAAMPFLGEKFSTFKSFAAASLQDIYTPERLQDSKKYLVTTLESGVLINDGTGRMQFRPLPRLAQISPGYGVVLTEVDGDGYPDLYLVHNFFGPQPETGRMDGGLSLLLRGSAEGTFTPLWPRQSGLIVPNDAKSLAVTDLNLDGWPDFIVGNNNDRLVAFQHQGSAERSVFTVRLVAPAGNPTAVGARVTLHPSGGPTQTAEVTAGSGYLSQSSGDLTFGWSSPSDDGMVEIRWPNGLYTKHPVSAGQHFAKYEFAASVSPP
jgi:hypothetical protein